MWQCPKCNRIFEKEGQVHTCASVSLAKHFEKKELAHEIFDELVGKINSEIGKYQVVSIPCCIHLFGEYDFLAVLPKKDHLEIRFALHRILKSPRMKQSVPVSQTAYKNCIDLASKEEIDKELLGWLKEAYCLKK